MADVMKKKEEERKAKEEERKKLESKEEQVCFQRFAVCIFSVDEQISVRTQL